MRRDGGFWHRSRTRETSEETNHRPLDESRRFRRRRARGEAREPPLLLRHRSPHFQSRCVSSSSSSKSEGFGANSTSKKFQFVVLLLLLLLLLLLFDIFQKTKDKERTKESKSFWKTRERQTFSRRLPFLSFLRSFTKKKLQIEAPLTSNINIMAKVRMTRTLFPWSRAFFSFSLALSEKRRTRAGERVVVGTFSARGPRGVRVKNVAEGNGKCFRIRSKKGARRMNARDARSDGRRRGVGTMRLDA